METQSNPFAVQTPEDISAEDVISLFVDVFTDFYQVPKPGHTFLHGPRGSGKSMMFRYMQPDCQSLIRGTLSSHPYFAVYVPIKSTDLHLIELARLENKHAALLINEHLMTMYVAVKAFASLAKVSIEDPEGAYAKTVRSFYSEEFFSLLQESGWEESLPTVDEEETPDSLFSKMMRICDEIYRTTLTYIRRLAFVNDVVTYTGPLCVYLDFLLPLMRRLKQLPFMPKGPVYLLIDDADNLNSTQTTILNTWVSCRTSSDISLKISTQLNYKTYRTVTGPTIDSPHDYSEVNISTVYTSSRNNYRKRVYDIVDKRLKMAKIEASPEEFFPPDEEQEAQISEIAETLKKDFPEKGRGYRVSDDVTRYARPMYIASLKGTSKSGSTYSYAGFDQLVHVSDGVVRYFLEAASLMYGKMLSKGKTTVLSIDPSVQNEVVKSLADQYLFSEFEKLEQDEAAVGELPDRAKKLRNLILALGGTFHLLLISDQSERRTFSIAFSDTPDKEILDILKLGVRYGYFHEASIGKKDGTGRTRRYVLSRRLAPYFLLDPTSFAGYKFVTSEAIRDAMRNPDAFIRRVKSRGCDEVFDNSQLNLFSED